MSRPTRACGPRGPRSTWPPSGTTPRCCAGWRPRPRLCAVVKADGYGHGAVAVARAALDGGASWLAVALVEEGVALRDAGVEAPVLVLSEPPAGGDGRRGGARGSRRRSTRRRRGGRLDAAARRRRHGGSTSTSRWTPACTASGADPVTWCRWSKAVARRPAAALRRALDPPGGGRRVDDPDDRAFTAEQLRRFDPARAALAAAGLDPPLVHLANSAGAIALPGARLRPGALRDRPLRGGARPPSPPCSTPPVRADRTDRVAVGGCARAVAGVAGLVRARPRRGRAAVLRPAPAPGQRSLVATVPLGYADGVPRRYFRRRGVPCSSAAVAVRWPGRSPWTRSWWTAVPAARSRWATRWC